ncbi:bifunctional lysylphosphatidylglycerol flippase/synthetase MprF [Streptomyces sp. NPDC052042]|uniref:bifunctional lysylphosphatidylglycerol flippase/synthetase MprF n=1 Tax=Streptomyces sp. NPDC052042 TaxID=3365683 RepID=UPI0037D2C137
MQMPDSLRPEPRASIVAALERHADNPSAFLALNRGNKYFSCDDLDGFVCYQVQGRRWIQLGGPFADPACREELESRFLAHAHEHGCKVIGAQLQRADAELLAALGLTVNQVGASYAVRLADFTLRGKRFVRLRNKISRAVRSGLEISEVDPDKCADEINSINERWLRDKGKHTKELSFLIGEMGGEWQALRKLYVGKIEGTAIAYVSYVPVYGSRPGWLHDLSRRLPDSPPGVMEAINARAIEDMRALEIPWLHFGFTPFTSLDSKYELPAASRTAARMVRFVADHGDRVYPAKSQLEYKSKWYPDAVLPEYFAFDGGMSFRSLWSVAKATNII